MPGALKLRSSLTPGTVVILLRGTHVGRRAVFLKELAPARGGPNGTLLVAGPNVPLRRINHRFVIATSTKLDISGVKVDVKASQLRRIKLKRRQKSEGEFLDEKKKSPKQPKTAKEPIATKEQRKELDAAIQKQLDPIINKEPMLREYLRSKFSLGRADRPHLMKF